MNEKQKPDLSTIEPIGRLPDDETATARREDDVHGGGTAAIPGVPPVAGMRNETDVMEPQSGPSDEERELEKLRRS